MQSQQTIMRRIQSIDVVRGLIMAIMALDHTRDYLHIPAVTDDPTNLATTYPILFFTRWATHFCAPTFLFLSGTSIYLQSLRKTKKELSFFLFTRGLWLVIAELTIVSMGWSFDPTLTVSLLQVIWAIGWSMIFLSGLIFLPRGFIVALGLLIFFAHDLFNYLAPVQSTPIAVLLKILFTTSGDFWKLGGHFIIDAYAILPWTGIMLLGFAIGYYYNAAIIGEAKRKNVLLAVGIGFTALFVLLRFTNHYGDPRPWAGQRTTTLTIISFFNVSKYPPSLMYGCMTLGPAMILLSVVENTRNNLARVLNIFGRVPFFYYLLHIYIIHIFTVILFFLQGHKTNEIVDKNSLFLFRPAQGFGLPLWGVYIAWLMVLIILYPLCKKYNAYKSTHKKWWLSYL